MFWFVLFQSLQGGFVNPKLLCQFPPGQSVEHAVTPYLLTGRLGVQEAIRHVSKEFDDFRELADVRHVVAELPSGNGRLVDVEPGRDIRLEESEVEPPLPQMVSKGK
jgi:hypothetical protein